MNEVKIELLPAFGGDCILITFEEIDYRILIDGGYIKTFSNSLTSRLQSLDATGKVINLLVVTHVDNDHIMGIIQLFRELDRKKINIQIKEIWYNGYRHLFCEKKQCVEGIQEKRVLDEVMKMVSSESEIMGKDIGYAQGETLAGLLTGTREKEWNMSFGGNAVCCYHDQGVAMKLYENRLSVILLNPGPVELRALEQEWDLFRRKKWLPMVNGNSVMYEKSFERFLAWGDSSVTNQSSIAFLLIFVGKKGKTYKLLFLGDASAERCLERLDGWKDIYFDCIKLPHHGSSNNIAQNTLKLLHMDYVLFSTDGKKYSHPDWEVVEGIACAETCAKMVFNYGDCMAAERAKREYAGRVVCGKEGDCTLFLNL